MNVNGTQVKFQNIEINVLLNFESFVRTKNNKICNLNPILLYAKSMNVGELTV